MLWQDNSLKDSVKKERMLEIDLEWQEDAFRLYEKKGVKQSSLKRG